MVTLYDNLIRVQVKPHEPGHGPKMLQSKPALSTVKEMYRKILQTRMIKVALTVVVEVKTEMIVEAEVEVDVVTEVLVVLEVSVEAEVEVKEEAAE